MRTPFEIKKDRKRCRAEIRRWEAFIEQRKTMLEDARKKLEAKSPLQNSDSSKDKLEYLTCELDVKTISYDIKVAEAKITIINSDIEKLEEELKVSQFVWDKVTEQMDRQDRMSRTEIETSVQDALDEVQRQ